MHGGPNLKSHLRHAERPPTDVQTWVPRRQDDDRQPIPKGSVDEHPMNGKRGDWPKEEEPPAPPLPHSVNSRIMLARGSGSSGKRWGEKNIAGGSDRDERVVQGRADVALCLRRPLTRWQRRRRGGGPFGPLRERKDGGAGRRSRFSVGIPAATRVRAPGSRHPFRRH